MRRINNVFVVMFSPFVVTNLNTPYVNNDMPMGIGSPRLLKAKGIALMRNSVDVLRAGGIAFELAAQSMNQRFEQMTVAITGAIIGPYTLDNEVSLYNAATVSNEQV